jgi:exonuclease SbcC
MKILRIKGCNLASLAGTFELDLTSGPLGRAGLFAITGPTGAGKSTLLDALCLALFDKTPRLEQAGKAWIGHGGRDDPHTLTAKDVRSVLRHDAGSGYAEADFVGSDGLRYRARWDVQRANKRPSGKLQAQKMGLECLDTGERSGGTKRQILQEISARLGLSFHQFQRSALLAQGEFAALLVADRGERAELLERMTGTDIYARVSVAAAEQFKETRDRVDALRAELGRVPGQDTPRGPLADRAAASQAGLEAARADLIRATGSNQWAQTLAQLTRQLDAGERQLQDAQLAIERAAPWRETLREVSALSALRADHRSLEGARGRAREAQAAAAELTTQHTAAQSAAAQSALVLTRAQDADARAQAELARCAPIWDEAVVLDAQLVKAAVELSQAAAARERAQTADLAAQTALQSLVERTHELASQEQVLRDWLAAHEQAQRVQPIWLSTERRLRRLARLRQEQSAHSLPELQRRLVAATAAEATCSQQGIAIQTELRSAREALRAARVDPAREQRVEERAARLREQSERLGAARGVHERALVAGRAYAEAERIAQTQAMAAVEEAQLAEETRKLLTVQRPLLAQAQATLARLRAAMDLSSHRAQLKPGAPCPLCGALEHPDADRGPLDPLVRDQTQRVEDQTRAVADLAEQLALAQERERAATLARRAAERTQASAQERLRSLAAHWPEHLGPDPQDPDLLDQAEDALQDARAAMELERTSLRTARAVLDAAQLHATELGHRAERAQATLEAAAAQTRAAQEAWTRAQSHAVALDEQVGALTQELTELLGGPVADPAATRTQLEADQHALASTQATHTSNRAAWTQAQLDHAGAAVVADQAAQALARTDYDLADAQGVHRSLQDRRRQLLDTPVDQARARVQGLAAQANTALQERAAQSAAALSRVSQLDAALQAARANAALADVALTEQTQALHDALAQASVSQDALERVVAVSDTWLDAHRALAQEQDAALVGASAVVQERRRQLAAHQAARPEGEPADPERLAALRAALQAAQSAHHAAQVALLQHDDNAGRAATLVADLAQAERTLAPLRIVRDLIGSAKGDKFRQFAQGLTLETLLAHANQHLTHLAPRYALMRVPSEDLEIQVIDRDLGDDVRSVNSLSGGESFMVSLALALGLSSMSARDTQVETLFIDEGFGSLDRKTLDTALATLDALQATGRTVGIISHVQGIGDHVGVQVRVIKEAPGRARVLVPQD